MFPKSIHITICSKNFTYFVSANSELGHLSNNSCFHFTTLVLWMCMGTAPLPHIAQWELRTQNLKSYLVRTQSLIVLPLKPGVGKYLPIHAALTARDFFLDYFYPSGPFTSSFSQNLSRFFLCWLWLTHGSCVGLQNKIGHPTGSRFPCWMPLEYK